MLLEKIKIKYLESVIIGLNIICLLSSFLLSYFNIIRISVTTMFLLIVLLGLYVCVFKNSKDNNNDGVIYFYAISFVGGIIYIMDIFFKLGSNLMR